MNTEEMSILELADKLRNMETKPEETPMEVQKQWDAFWSRTGFGTGEKK